MENRKIEKIDFQTTEFEEEYYGCTFENCDFSNSSIVKTQFEECTFRNCNFSLAKLCIPVRDCTFTECKMTGTDFSGLDQHAASFKFERCNLTYASFIGVKSKGIRFQACDLLEASFENADIRASVFDKCNLARASFFDTNLERVDFASSYNFSIDPNHNRLKKAIFSAPELRGLLSHLNIEIIEPGQK